MAIHSHSVESFRALNHGERCAMVLSVYADHKEPLTDRRVMELLGFTDKNSVSPRVSKLIEDGFLYEEGSTKCPVTGRRVRLVSYTGLVNPV